MISPYLHKFDAFPYRNVGFSHRGAHSSYSTTFGGALTLLFFGLLVFLVWVRVIEMNEQTDFHKDLVEFLQYATNPLAVTSLLNPMDPSKIVSIDV